MLYCLKNILYLPCRGCKDVPLRGGASTDIKFRELSLFILFHEFFSKDGKHENQLTS